MSMCMPPCRYAVEQLTWLVTQLASSGNPAFLAQLQKNIELCDQQSGSNSSVRTATRMALGLIAPQPTHHDEHDNFRVCY